MTHSEPAKPVAAFIDRIRRMNEIFDIERFESPMYLGVGRLEKFRKTLSDEVLELDDIVAAAAPVSGSTAHVDQLKVLTALADFLGDVVVYSFSEARRWGIPLDQVLHAIMDSQDSKLVDGKALKDENNKFLKGPGYKPPEPAIEAILTAAMPDPVTVRPVQATFELRANIPRFRPLGGTCKRIYSGPLLDGLVPLVQPRSPAGDRIRAARILDVELADAIPDAKHLPVVPESLRMTVPGETGPRGIVFDVG
jgi:hypothetical protein